MKPCIKWYFSLSIYQSLDSKSQLRYISMQLLVLRYTRAFRPLFVHTGNFTNIEQFNHQCHEFAVAFFLLSLLLSNCSHPFFCSWIILPTIIQRFMQHLKMIKRTASTMQEEGYKLQPCSLAFLFFDCLQNAKTESEDLGVFETSMSIRVDRGGEGPATDSETNSSCHIWLRILRSLLAVSTKVTMRKFCHSSFKMMKCVHKAHSFSKGTLLTTPHPLSTQVDIDVPYMINDPRRLYAQCRWINSKCCF